MDTNQQQQNKEGDMQMQQDIDDENSEQRDRPEYRKKEFWNARYQDHKGFYDWYIGYREFRQCIEKQCIKLDKNAKILMVGCGNSKLSEDMYDDGYKDIINIDISDVVVNQMQEDANNKNKNLVFLEMDATQMSFPDEQFDAVIEKGTLDALLCGQDYSVTDKMLLEMSRVLKPTGQIIIISFGSIEERKPIFENCLGFEKYSYFLCKKNLSQMSQLINIMRINSNGKPLKSIMQNKFLILKTMLEFQKVKQDLENEIFECNKIDWSTVIKPQDKLQESKQEEPSVLNKELKSEQSQQQSESNQYNSQIIQQSNDKESSQSKNDQSQQNQQLEKHQVEVEDNNINQNKEIIQNNESNDQQQLQKEDKQNTKENQQESIDYQQEQESNKIKEESTSISSNRGGGVGRRQTFCNIYLIFKNNINNKQE